MPLLENKSDRRGRPICPKCGQPILRKDGVALMEDSMIHACCVSRSPSAGAVTAIAPSRGLPGGPGHASDARGGGDGVRLGERLRRADAA